MRSPEATSNWRMVTAFAAVGASTQFLWLTFAPSTSDVATHYGVSESAVGWLANVFPLWYVVLAIPAGLLLDRAFRAGLGAGAVLTAAGAVVRLFADDYLAAFLGQTLVAMAQPLVLNAITGTALRYLSPADRAKGIALGSASTFAGMIVAFVLATALPLHTVLWVDAAAAIVASAALLVALRRRPVHAPRVAPAALASFRSTARNPLVRRLCVAVFVPFGTFTALTTWAEALLKPSGVSSDRAGVLLLANIVCGVAGSAVLPVWAARRRLEVKVMVTAVLVTVAACVVLAVVPGFVIALALFGVFGFFLLATLPIVLEIMERAAEDAEGTASGLVWLAGQLGALVVTAVIGLLVHHATTSFAVLAGVTLLAAGAGRSIRPYLPDGPAAAQVEAQCTT